MNSPTTQQCPQCQATIPVHEGFLSWCTYCEWNLRTGTNDVPLSFVDRFYATMSRKHSNALFTSVVQAGVHKPPFSASIFFAYVLAVLIHLCSAALFAAGCLLIVLGWSYFFIVSFGVLCLGVTWLMRPRFAAKPASILARGQFPMLYQLVDSISEHLGTPRVDGIVLNEKFNAAFGRVGIKQEKILWLGLPLWYVLSNEEKIDLLAHEIAHDVNNDYRAMFLVSSATRILLVLHDVLTPTEIWPTSMGLLGFAAVPVTLLSLGFARMARYCALAFAHLLWSNSQRAEYYADILAASVGGQRAALGGLEKLLCHRVINSTIRSFALRRTSEGDIFENLSRSLTAVPHSEIERLRRASQYETDRMDISHPPTALRLQMIEQFGSSDAALRFPTSLFEAIEKEIQTLKEHIQQRIVENYKASLYW